MGLMIGVALLGIGLALIGQVWHSAVQREKEKELLFIGNEFRRAILSFHESSPGGVQRYPRSLDELLEDRRFPTSQRHLRRLYRDPMTDSAKWGLATAPDGSIMGVFSLSEVAPRKISGFRSRDDSFAGARRYSDWKFGNELPVVAKNATGTPGPGDPALPPAGPSPGDSTEPAVAEPPRKPPTKCERMSAADQASCTGIATRWTGSDGDQCRNSAAARLAACEAGQAVPPLYIRYL